MSAAVPVNLQQSAVVQCAVQGIHAITGICRDVSRICGSYLAEPFSVFQTALVSNLEGKDWVILTIEDIARDDDPAALVERREGPAMRQAIRRVFEGRPRPHVGYSRTEFYAFLDNADHDFFEWLLEDARVAGAYAIGFSANAFSVTTLRNRRMDREIDHTADEFFHALGQKDLRYCEMLLSLHPELMSSCVLEICCQRNSDSDDESDPNEKPRIDLRRAHAIWELGRREELAQFPALSSLYKALMEWRAEHQVALQQPGAVTRERVLGVRRDWQRPNLWIHRPFHGAFTSFQLALIQRRRRLPGDVYHPPGAVAAGPAPAAAAAGAAAAVPVPAAAARPLPYEDRVQRRLAEVRRNGAAGATK